MIKIIKYNNNGKQYVFASNGDTERFKLEGTSLDKINQLDGTDLIIDIIEQFLSVGIYPTFNQIMEVYNTIKKEEAEQAEPVESDLVTYEWIEEVTKDAPTTRTYMMLYKDILSMFGENIDKTTFIKDINNAIDLQKYFFGDFPITSGYVQTKNDKDLDTKYSMSTSCDCFTTNDFTEYNNINRNIVRDEKPSKTTKTKTYKFSEDLKDFLKENGYTTEYNGNYYKSNLDPYEGYYNKTNKDYDEYYKRAYEAIKKSEDRIGSEIDSLIKDFTLYLKKGEFKYALVNEFSKEYLKQGILSKNSYVLVEIRGVFEVFLNGFIGSSKMMKRLLHLIDIENANRIKIKELLETELRTCICNYGAEVINKKFSYLIKTNVYYENYKYYVKVETANR